MSPERAASERPRQTGAPPPAPGGDQVELSESAANYDPETEAARAMEMRIESIRAQIAEDQYITPDKIDIVVERLLEELRAG